MYFYNLHAHGIKYYKWPSHCFSSQNIKIDTRKIKRTQYLLNMYYK